MSMTILSPTPAPSSRASQPSAALDGDASAFDAALSTEVAEQSATAANENPQRGTAAKNNDSPSDGAAGDQASAPTPVTGDSAPLPATPATDASTDPTVALATVMQATWIQPTDATPASTVPVDAARPPVGVASTAAPAQLPTGGAPVAEHTAPVEVVANATAPAVSAVARPNAPLATTASAPNDVIVSDAEPTEPREESPRHMGATPTRTAPTAPVALAALADTQGVAGESRARTVTDVAPIKAPALAQADTASAPAASNVTAPVEPVSVTPSQQQGAAASVAAAAPAAGATVSAPGSSPVTAPPAPAPVATPVLAEQIAPRIASLRQMGEGQHVLTLRVTPESLGPVRVVAHITGDGMRVELLGATEQAREALKAVLSDLRRDLAAASPNATLDLGSQRQNNNPTPDQRGSGPQAQFGNEDSRNPHTTQVPADHDVQKDSARRTHTEPVSDIQPQSMDGRPGLDVYV